MKYIALLAILLLAPAVAVAQRGPVTSVADPELEKLSDHNLDVGRQYYKKKAYEGAKGRLEEIVAVYPEYTKLDEVYYLLGMVYLKTKAIDAAKDMFTRLVDERSESEFAPKAREELDKLGQN
jgi:outer membrane protein assembly factor BamD